MQDDFKNLIESKNPKEIKDYISILYGDSVTSEDDIDNIFTIPKKVLDVISIKDFVEAIYSGSYYDDADALKKAMRSKTNELNFTGRKYELSYIIYMFNQFGLKKEDYAQDIFDISIASNREGEVLYCLNNLDVNVNCSHYLEASNDCFEGLKKAILDAIIENDQIKNLSDSKDELGNNLFHVLCKELSVKNLEKEIKSCKLSEEDITKMLLSKNNAGNIPFFEFVLIAKKRTAKKNNGYEKGLNNLITSGDLNFFFNLYTDDKKIASLFECNKKGENLKSILDSHSLWPKDLKEKLSHFVVSWEKNILTDIINIPSHPAVKIKRSRI